MVTGICDPNISQTRHHHSLKLGSKLKYLNKKKSTWKSNGSLVIGNFNKKASIDTHIEESRDCGNNPFLLEKKSQLAKILEREAELEYHTVINDIYEKYLDNSKHQ